MNIPAEHLPIPQELCRSQPLAALAADAGSHPYVIPVAAAVTDNLRRLYFATPRATRKWANRAMNPQVSPWPMGFAALVRYITINCVRTNAAAACLFTMPSSPASMACGKDRENWRKQ